MSRLKNVILTTLMILAACFGGTKAYIDHHLGLELDKSIQSVADKILIEYADIRLSLLGSLIINDLRLSLPNSLAVQIESVTLLKAYQFYDLKTLPKQFSIAIQGLQLPISNSAPPVPVLMSAFGYAPYYLTPKALRGLGYARLKADVNFQALVSEKQTSVLIRANMYAWGKSKLSLDLNYVPVQIASLVKTVGRIQLANLIFSYTNKGLVNRIFKKLAQHQKMTLAGFKQKLSNKLTSDITQSGLKLDNSVLISMRQFIQNPQTLTVYLQPNPPRTINTLLNTSPKSLGLKMTTQR